MRSISIALVVAWAGCFFDLHQLGPFPCAIDSTCPDTFACVDRVCVPENVCGADKDPEVCDGVCTSFATDVHHCGSCDTDCEVPHASASCVAKSCRFSCDPGFSDCNGDRLDGCEASLSAPGTCGSCGRHCGAEACVGGTCVAETVLGPEREISFITFANGYLYLAIPAANPAPGQYLPTMIKRCQVSACAQTLVTLWTGPLDAAGPDIVIQLLVDGSKLFWQNYHGVYGCVENNCAATIYEVGRSDEAAGLAVDAQSIYWIDDFGVYGCPKTGCSDPNNPTRLVQAYPSLGLRNLPQLVYLEHELLWTDGTRIYGALDSGSPRPITMMGGTSAQGGYQSLALYDHTLVVGSGSAVQTFQWLDGSMLMPLHLEPTSTVQSVAADGVGYYWLDKGDPAQIGSSTLGALAPVDPGHAMTGCSSSTYSGRMVAVDGAFVYWTDCDSTGQYIVRRVSR